MAFIKAYIFNNITDAENAIKLINDTLGIPVSENAITKTYTYYEINNNNIIIKHDETIENILGVPSEYDYIIQEFNI